MAYIALDGNSRITAISNDFHIGENEVEIDLPEGFDINQHFNYKVVDGEFVFDEYVPEIPIELQIDNLKKQLEATDYVAVKIAEGAATREEYADLLEQRQKWREQINELESI